MGSKDDLIWDNESDKEPAGAIGDETATDTQISKATHKRSRRDSAKKKSKVFLRVLILVVAFCLVVFAGIILSDIFFDNPTATNEPEIIVIKVSGADIILNENNKITLDELDEYLGDLDKRGELSTVALINDTARPADLEVYNSIAGILKKYGIVCETLPYTSTNDEATADELTRVTISAQG